MQSLVEEDGGSFLILLGNLNMDSLHNLALGLQKGVGGGGSCRGKGESLRSLKSIPDVLELEAKSYRGTIWVEPMQDGLQKLGEAVEVHVFMGVKQPSNLGDKGGLDGADVDAVTKTLHVRLEDFVEVLLWGIVSNQDTKIHFVCDFLGAEILEVLANRSMGLPKFIWCIQNFFVEGEAGFIQ